MLADGTKSPGVRGPWSFLDFPDNPGVGHKALPGNYEGAANFQAFQAHCPKDNVLHRQKEIIALLRFLLNGK